MVSMPRCGCHGKPLRKSSGRSLRKSSNNRNGSNSLVSPNPNPRCSLTPAPSMVGVDATTRLTGRKDIKGSQISDLGLQIGTSQPASSAGQAGGPVRRDVDIRTVQVFDGGAA